MKLKPVWFFVFPIKIRVLKGRIRFSFSTSKYCLILELPEPSTDCIYCKSPELHCDPRYWFYKIFMPHVFKMSIAIH